MITLRPVAPNDKGIFADSSYELLPEKTLRQMIAESVSQKHRDKYFELFAVIEDGQCVGFVSLYGDEKEAVSLGPEIKPQHRKQGIAFTAMGQALTYAKQQGFARAVAQVRTDNAASIALHNKLGFCLRKEYLNKKGNAVFGFEKAL